MSEEIYVDRSKTQEARIVARDGVWVYLERRAMGSTMWRPLKLPVSFWESSANGWRKRDAAT